MKRLCCFLVLAFCSQALPGQATLPCQTIRGRAHLFTGDGQLRIWNIGTHHEFEPDASSWPRVQSWLEEGVTPAQKQQQPLTYAGDVFLYGDFVVCPTKPYRKGSVQPAVVKSVTHRRYTPAD